MRSFKHQVLILLLGSLVILAVSFLVVLGWYMKDRGVAAAIIKAKADLATCGEIIDTKYPGSWSVRDEELYKGPIKISLNNEIVDHLSRLTGDNVTIFLGETRVATTVRGTNGERTIGTKVSAQVAQTVLQNGQTYLGEADVVDQWSQVAYVPLRAENGTIIGMFYVGIPHTYDQEFIRKSLQTMAVFGLSVTLLVALIACFVFQKLILSPLRNIELGTREVTAEHLTQRIKGAGTKEIKELEQAFKQMEEQIRSLTEEINQTIHSNPEHDPPENKINALEELIEGSERIPEPTPELISEPIPELAPTLTPELTATPTPMPTSKPTVNPTVAIQPKPNFILDTPWWSEAEGLPKGLNKITLNLIEQFLQANRRPLSAEEVGEGVKLTRVTVRHYLEFLEQRGVLKSEQKYGTVGRPVKLFIPLK